MTKVEKIIMVLLIVMIILFGILLATDNVQILIIVGDKIKTGAEKIDWKDGQEFNLKSARASFLSL